METAYFGNENRGHAIKRIRMEQLYIGTDSEGLKISQPDPNTITNTHFEI